MGPQTQEKRSAKRKRAAKQPRREPKGTRRECGWNRCNLVVSRRLHHRAAPLWRGPIWDVVRRVARAGSPVRAHKNAGMVAALLLNATLAGPCGMSLAPIVSRRCRRHWPCGRDPAAVQRGHFAEIVSRMLSCACPCRLFFFCEVLSLRGRY